MSFAVAHRSAASFRLMPKKTRRPPASTPPADTRTPDWGWRMVPIVLILFCALLYGWTLRYPMVFDDEVYLLNNPLFQAASFTYPFHLEAFLTTPRRLGLDTDLAVNFVTRPVSYATFYLNFLLSGWDTAPFRLVNLILHTGCSLLLHAVLRLLVRRLECAGRIGRSSALFIPAAAAILFAVHPLAVESVTYIVQRFTTLAAFWSLLAAWLHLRSMEEKLPAASAAWLRWLAVLVMLAGMLTKECAAVTPLLIVMVDVMVAGTAWRKALRHAAPLLATTLVIPALVLLCASVLQGGGLDLDGGMNLVNSREKPLSSWHYLLTQITVSAGYLRLLLWPAGQNIDPDWPVQTGLLSPGLAGALMLHLSLLLAAILAWRSHRTADGRPRLVLAFLLWFYIGIAPSSSLVPLPDMMAEHRSYLPSAGVFVVLACLADLLRQRLAGRRRAAQLAAAGVLLLFAGTTVSRNLVWRDAESLWRDAAAKSPGKFRVWSNLGVALTAKGREREAVECHRRAVELQPAFANGVLNLSNSLLRLNRAEEALRQIDQLAQRQPGADQAPPFLYTRALGCMKGGRLEQALRFLDEALKKDASHAFCLRLAGIIHMELGQHREALVHLRQAGRLMPADEDLHRRIRHLEEWLARE